MKNLNFVGLRITIISFEYFSVRLSLLHTYFYVCSALPNPADDSLIWSFICVWLFCRAYLKLLPLPLYLRWSHFSCSSLHVTCIEPSDTQVHSNIFIQLMSMRTLNGLRTRTLAMWPIDDANIACCISLKGSRCRRDDGLNWAKLSRRKWCIWYVLTIHITYVCQTDVANCKHNSSAVYIKQCRWRKVRVVFLMTAASNIWRVLSRMHTLVLSRMHTSCWKCRVQSAVDQSVLVQRGRS